MWVQELTIENIKCFEKLTLKMGDRTSPHKWITLLGENGVGKSTLLQALGLLLAGPEGANQLMTKPLGWVRDESRSGKISARIHKSNSDPGEHGEVKKRAAFSYTYFITGSRKIAIRNREYTEPAVVPNNDKTLSWLRQNAFPSKGSGWFASGYGAFRRLTRGNQIIVPSLQTPERYTGFQAQFDESEPLAVFEQWFVYLDYRIAKEKDPVAQKQRELGLKAINRVLPPNAKFDSVSGDGRVLFNVNGERVSTIGLSDGYRSILALSGDLIWRLLMAFPNTDDIFKEEGTVLIDELDIHLHPKWQREIPRRLRELFPNLQFIVSTHSPFVAAGAGHDAITYRLKHTQDGLTVDQIENLAFMGVEEVLKSSAFEVVSVYSTETQNKIDRYFTLKRKANRSAAENNEIQLELVPVIKEALVDENSKSALELRMDQYLSKKLA